MEAKARAASAMAPPIRMPITPPMPESMTASIRNCTRISDLRAPMALRTPISAVRSVTEISMMFITPMPPTSSPTPPIMPVSSTIAPVS